MKNKYLIYTSGFLLLAFCNTSFSAIAPYAHLEFSASNVVCTTGYSSASNNGCQDGLVDSFTGSYWALDANGDEVINDVIEWNYIAPFQGIDLGYAQPASGSHSGLPDGTENPSIDIPWIFFGNTVMHQSTSPVDVLSDDGNGNVTLDFSGWGLIWNGIEDWHMGDPANFVSDTEVATLTCAIDCSAGDSFALDYSGHTPIGHYSNINGVKYSIHLEGVVSTVPLPPAILLFFSGIAVLVGFGKHRHIQG